MLFRTRPPLFGSVWNCDCGVFGEMPVSAAKLPPLMYSWTLVPPAHAAEVVTLKRVRSLPEFGVKVSVPVAAALAAGAASSAAPRATALMVPSAATRLKTVFTEVRSPSESGSADQVWLEVL